MTEGTLLDQNIEYQLKHSKAISLRKNDLPKESSPGAKARKQQGVQGPSIRE